ncbi:CarD family transcriptional regulator [Desulfonatronum thioautotrophicum]|uniref:CarD family transcriptional regulator n=1 Tax=Desulfonatronum thioautotrophicum TaxID=617001 RepID=UPI0005EB1D20|nr:CarD family transcriptional regulator [Desulfonatronum thioautotrophicum]
MFSVNDLVVYPAQGVGKIEKIESQEIGGCPTNLYVIRILNNNIMVMVPVHNATNVGLRPLCTSQQGEEMLEYIRDRSDFTGYTGQNWNRRYREYSEKLKSENLQDVAYVLKELILIGKDKELSFGERRLLEQALQLITTELALCLDSTPTDIRTRIYGFFDDILKKTEEEEVPIEGVE